MSKSDVGVNLKLITGSVTYFQYRFKWKYRAGAFQAVSYSLTASSSCILIEEQQMNATAASERPVKDTSVTANNPSDNPERIFEQYSIPIKSADSFPELKILTTESPAFRIHVNSN